jgi:hypothetical protein
VYEFLRKTIEKPFLDNSVINPSQFGFFSKSSILAVCSQLIMMFMNQQVDRNSGDFVACIFAFDCAKKFDFTE